MTGWQMAMTVLDTVPQTLDERYTLHGNTAKPHNRRPRADCVRRDEFEVWQRMKQEGLSHKQIGAITGRTERTIRRYLTGESHVYG